MKSIGKTIFYLVPLLFLLFWCAKKPADANADYSVQKNRTECISESIGYSMRPSPTGEIPVTLENLKQSISAISQDKVKANGFVVAVSMHDLRNDWSQSLVNGLKTVFEKYGVVISIITDGEFDVSKQIADIENIIATKPDVLITLPLDAKKCAPVLQKARTAGIKLVFADAIPEGFRVGVDYIGWATGDGYRMGQLSAATLAENLPDSSTIALMHWKNSMFTVDERSKGARSFFTDSTDCLIVKELSFNEFHEISGLVESLTVEYPDLDGFWTVWDAPALEAMKAFQRNNKKISVSTCDLSRDAYLAISKKEMLVGVAFDHPYHEGVALGYLAIGGVLDIAMPSYCTILADNATVKNLDSAWLDVYHQPFKTTLGGGVVIAE